ncbi:MAG: hypothetical protein ACE5DQ_00555 [Candidatus Paceibacterota bacterium]
MNILVIILILFLASILLAARSMKDIVFERDVLQMLQKRKLKQVIVFFKDKVTHYSSNSSESS